MGKYYLEVPSPKTLLTRESEQDSKERAGQERASGMGQCWSIHAMSWLRGIFVLYWTM